MAYNENLAFTINGLLSDKQSHLTQRKMFGGLCIMYDGHMLCGVMGDEVFLRVSPAKGEELIKQKGVRPMIHKGRTMTGFLYLDESQSANEKDLKNWLQLGLDFVTSLPKKN
jgi:TfoX/Sxy family transcriptional regulator of competence genes